MTRLVLASQSASRRAMLSAARVPHEALAPGVDEEAARESLRAAGLDARALADALAELKALRVSRRLPGALVLGCDTIVALEDGTMFDKPADRAAAAAQLRALRGRSHKLTSAAVVCQNGVPVWRHVDTVRLAMRDFSDEFLVAYLDAEGDAVLGSCGGYRIEEMGAQLFARISGDHFTILGLPLLPLLDWLRVRGVIAT